MVKQSSGRVVLYSNCLEIDYPTISAPFRKSLSGL